MYDPILSVMSCSSPPHHSEWALLCSYCWRKECPHDLCQVIPWPKRLPPWQNQHPLLPKHLCVCTLPVSQCHVLPSRIVTMCPGSALLHVPDPCYCHIVSAWIKRACMPQLSKTEMDFDFRNPAASVRHSPLTQVLTAQECPDVLPCATAIMRWKDSQIFTHAVAI